MKVLHVIPSVSLVHGGPSHAIALMERALRIQGIQVETATTDDDGPGARDGKRIGVAINDNGVLRRYFAKRTEFYKVSPGFVCWILRHAQDYHVVHIHALFSFTSIMAAWVARLAGVPYVIRPLGTLARYGVTQRRPCVKRFSLKWLEGPILRHAAEVHFTADGERREAELLGIPMRAVVIPLAVESLGLAAPDMLYSVLPELRTRPYLLFLSRLDPKKNVEGLLRAFRLCHNEMPDYRLVIAGDGKPEYVSHLKHLAADLDISGYVIWTGFVDGQLKAGLLAGARLFVLPSYSENFGIAAAEALMAGLPCVLGRGVAIAADVELAGAGVAVEPDAESIAAGMRPYLMFQTLQDSASQSARRYALQEYSLDVMGRRLVELYQSVVER